MLCRISGTENVWMEACYSRRPTQYIVHKLRKGNEAKPRIIILLYILLIMFYTHGVKFRNESLQVFKNFNLKSMDDFKLKSLKTCKLESNFQNLS